MGTVVKHTTSCPTQTNHFRLLLPLSFATVSQSKHKNDIICYAMRDLDDRQMVALSLTNKNDWIYHFHN